MLTVGVIKHSENPHRDIKTKVNSICFIDIKFKPIIWAEIVNLELISDKSEWIQT